MLPIQATYKDGGWKATIQGPVQEGYNNHKRAMVGVLGSSAHSVSDSGFWGFLQKTPGEQSRGPHAWGPLRDLQQFKAGDLSKAVENESLSHLSRSAFY